MNGQKPDPEAPSTPADGEGSADDRLPARWIKRVLALAGAIVVLGGAVTVITQTTHLFGSLTHASASACPSSTEFERSPNLGISFYQNGELAPMSQSDTGGTGQNSTVSVCMKSEPFEVWFPALGAQSSLSICASTDGAVFSNMFEQGGFNCLSPITSAANFNYANGSLYEASPQVLVHSALYGTRVQSASGGDQKYYVSNLVTPGLTASSRHSIPLTSQNGKLYFVIYMNDNNDTSFEPNNVEDFIVSFNS
jgi:hypothetical protein